LLDIILARKGETKVNELTKEDWVEIYYALDSKKKGVEDGEYGDVARERKTWAAHLEEIMEKLWGDGENMTQPPETRYFLVAVEDDIEAALHGPFLTEEARDAEARRMRNESFFDGGIYWMDITAPEPLTAKIDTYSGAFFGEEEGDES
jgi:hypothetical protein